jgi:hypothetical protein
LLLLLLYLLCSLHHRLQLRPGQLGCLPHTQCLLPHM